MGSSIGSAVPAGGGVGRSASALAGLAMLAAMGSAQARTFSMELGGEDIDVISNTALIGGAAVRVERRDKRLVGATNNDPNRCGRSPDPSGQSDGFLYYQVCQGVFKDQIFPAERIATAPGMASLNFDQGNLNYDRGDLIQAPVRLNQDFQFTWGDFGLFVKGFAFYDPVNEDFQETHPNRITAENVDHVGFASKPGTELIRGTQDLSVLAPVISQISNSLMLPPNLLTQLLSNPTGIPTLGVRNDARPCPADRNPNGGPCGLVYGPGGHVKSKRRDHETLREIGAGIHLLDLNVYGVVDVGQWYGGDKHEVTFKVGRQLINWGESTVQFFDSLNVANPASVNNLFRLGGNGLDDFFLPINAISLTTELIPSGILSVHYQLEWNPLVAPSPGRLSIQPGSGACTPAAPATTSAR